MITLKFDVIISNSGVKFKLKGIVLKDDSFIKIKNPTAITTENKKNLI